MAGTLIDPPISDPIPKGEQPEEISEPSPPEEPPQALYRSHGFRARPYIWLVLSKVIATWGILLLIKGIAPASRSICTARPF